jgi:ABC-type spermidine/putrescine transport system permease subunit II
MLYAAVVAVLLGAVGVMAAMTLEPGPQPKEPMYVLFALAVVAPAIIVAIAARRRRLRMRQMQALRAQL